mgnify:CR=1 FL=1
MAFQKGKISWNKGIPNTWYNPKGLEIGRGYFKGKKMTQESCVKMSLARIGKKASLATRKKMSIAIKNAIPRGENHYKWNPDREYIKHNKRDNVNAEYHLWARNIKRRDGWICKIKNIDCYGRLEAHHILPWSQFPELRYELNNGITLCQFHHPRTRIEETKWASHFQGIVHSIAH